MTTLILRHRKLLFCLLLGLVTLSVYWEIGRHEFVSFDDGMYVSENAHVREGLTKESIKWAFGFTEIAYWHPITWLSHMLDVELYGLNPGMHHITNLIFHILNVLLLFLILNRVTGDFWRSGFVAALLALHPINVESVAWLAERKNVLSTFFWMLTLMSYVFYSERSHFSLYLLTLMLFTFGLMCKPFLVTLPFVLLLMDFWPLERIRIAALRPGDNQKSAKAYLLQIKEAKAFDLVLEKIPFFILALISVYLSFLSAKGHGIILTTQAVPFHLRLANAVVSYMGYIGKTIWPHKLAVFYPYPGMVPMWLTLATGIWLIGTTFLMLHRLERFPYLSVGWLWYIITLMPNIGIIQAGLWPAMADRWAYIPLIGIFIIASWGIPELVVHWRHRRAGLSAFAVTVISVIMVVTWLQIRYWVNSITLYRHALDVTIKNDVAHNNLGAALYFSGNVDEAIVHFIEALRIMPDYQAASDNLNTALAAHARNKDAVANMENLLKAYPGDPTLQYLLGNLYKSRGVLDKAIEQYENALAQQPRFAGAMYHLALIHATRQEYNRALFLLNKIIEIEPENLGAYYNITAIYAIQNKRQESIQWLKKAVKKGFKNWTLLKFDKKLNNIRKTEYFQALIGMH
ncbi:MAG: tetratricopeptide repeat protein [Desulfobacterales bacterium]